MLRNMSIMSFDAFIDSLDYETVDDSSFDDDIMSDTDSDTETNSEQTTETYTNTVELLNIPPPIRHQMRNHREMDIDTDDQGNIIINMDMDMDMDMDMGINTDHSSYTSSENETTSDEDEEEEEEDFLPRRHQQHRIIEPIPRRITRSMMNVTLINEKNNLNSLLQLKRSPSPVDIERVATSMARDIFLFNFKGDYVSANRLMHKYIETRSRVDTEWSKQIKEIPINAAIKIQKWYKSMLNVVGRTLTNTRYSETSPVQKAFNEGKLHGVVSINGKVIKEPILLEPIPIRLAYYSFFDNKTRVYHILSLSKLIIETLSDKDPITRIKLTKRDIKKIYTILTRNGFQDAARKVVYVFNNMEIIKEERSDRDSFVTGMERACNVSLADAIGASVNEEYTQTHARDIIYRKLREWQEDVSDFFSAFPEECFRMLKTDIRRFHEPLLRLDFHNCIADIVQPCVNDEHRTRNNALRLMSRRQRQRGSMNNDGQFVNLQAYTQANNSLRHAFDLLATAPTQLNNYDTGGHQTNVINSFNRY